MRYELKSIGIWAFIKVAFVVNLLAGFIAGLFAVPMMAVFMAATEAVSYADPDAFVFDETMAGPVLMGVPVLLGLGAAIMGTMFQTIVILLYNMLARLVGGLELTLAPVVSTEPGPSPVQSSVSSASVAAPAPAHEPALPPPPPPPPPPGTESPKPPTETKPPVETPGEPSPTLPSAEDSDLEKP